MTIRTHVRTVALAALLAALLAGCGGSDDGSGGTGGDGKPKPTADATVDCGPDSTLSQAEWMEQCSDQATEPSPPPDGPLTLGQTYKWADGFQVAVTKAEQVTSSGLEPGEMAFRLRFRLHNAGKQPLDLEDFTTFVEGATRGGEAIEIMSDSDTDGITGRLAPGITTTKTLDYSINKKYGPKIVIELMHIEGDAVSDDFPEVTATIQ